MFAMSKPLCDFLEPPFQSTVPDPANDPAHYHLEAFGFLPNGYFYYYIRRWGREYATAEIYRVNPAKNPLASEFVARSPLRYVRYARSRFTAHGECFYVINCHHAEREIWLTSVRMEPRLEVTQYRIIAHECFMEGPNYDEYSVHFPPLSATSTITSLPPTSPLTSPSYVLFSSIVHRRPSDNRRWWDDVYCREMRTLAYRLVVDESDRTATLVRVELPELPDRAWPELPQYIPSSLCLLQRSLVLYSDFGLVFKGGDAGGRPLFVHLDRNNQAHVCSEKQAAWERYALDGDYPQELDNGHDPPRREYSPGQIQLLIIGGRECPRSHRLTIDEEKRTYSIRQCSELLRDPAFTRNASLDTFVFANNHSLFFINYGEPPPLKQLCAWRLIDAFDTVFKALLTTQWTALASVRRYRSEMDVRPHFWVRPPEIIRPCLTDAEIHELIGAISTLSTQ